MNETFFQKTKIFSFTHHKFKYETKNESSNPFCYQLTTFSVLENPNLKKPNPNTFTSCVKSSLSTSAKLASKSATPVGSYFA